MLETLSREDQTVNPLEVLDAGIERLREEHVVLKQQLNVFHDAAKMVGQDEGVVNWSDSIHKLAKDIEVFMTGLDIHSEWEDQVLFPMVQEYTGKDMAPVSDMESEHELAKQHVKRFLEAAGRLQAPVNGGEAKDAASFLLQAHAILTDHFKKEEEVLFPMAEQMLTDFEQFFIS